MSENIYRAVYNVRSLGTETKRVVCRFSSLTDLDSWRRAGEIRDNNFEGFRGHDGSLSLDGRVTLGSLYKILPNLDVEQVSMKSFLEVCD